MAKKITIENVKARDFKRGDQVIKGETGETATEEINGLISVEPVADIFGLSDEEVSKRVARERRRARKAREL